MIILTKIDGKDILINEQQIEAAQETPDTVITMASGHTYIVTDSVADICDKVSRFRRDTAARQKPAITQL